MKKKIGILGVLVCLAIFIIIITTNKIHDDEIVAKLDKYVALMNEREISYYLNSNSCKKLIFSSSSSSEQFWFAEPRSIDCGSTEKYIPFTDTSLQLFDSIKEANTGSDANIKVSEIERTLFESQMVFSVIINGNHKSEYLYDPKHISKDEEENKKINDDWSLILYNPSPF